MKTQTELPVDVDVTPPGWLQPLSSFMTTMFFLTGWSIGIAVTYEECLYKYFKIGHVPPVDIFAFVYFVYYTVSAIQCAIWGASRNSG